MTATATELEEGAILYLHLSDNTPSEEETIKLADGSEATVIWKDVLVAGEYPMTPTMTGAVERKLTVIPEGESSREKNIVSLSDIMTAHKDGAFKYVTIPTRHADGPLDNTGYVPQPDGLRKVERDGTTVMQAALGFTEPDVKGKVQRGTIPDVSAGIFFNWLNKHTKKAYRCAMKHVALTPVPFMGNLTPFKPVFASDDDLTENMTVYHFALNDGTTDDSSGDGGSSKTGEVIWDETMGFNWVRQQIEEQLNPRQDSSVGNEEAVVVPIRRPSYYVSDVSSDVALVSEFYKGESTRFLIPYKKSDGSVEVAPSIRWVEVKEAMIAASDDNDNDFESLSTDMLREKLGHALSSQLGDESSGYQIDAISLDRRVRIKSTTDDSTWTAPFGIVGGEVFLASKWNKVSAPEADVTPPASVPTPAPESQVSITASDPITAQVMAARQRRAALLSSSR